MIRVFGLVLGMIFMLYGQVANGQEKTCVRTEGQVIAKAATRGTLQYLLQVDDEFYYPENLPKEFRKDSLKVTVHYKLLDKMDTVYKPAPNDLLEFDFLARVIRINKIKEKASGSK